MISRQTVVELRYLLDYCRKNGFDFNACLTEARKQYQRETREAALKEVTQAKD